MKKHTKSILVSSLLAVAFGAMSVGTTFALFTSETKTTINVESGIVDVKSSLTHPTLYSASATYTTGDVAGTLTGAFAGTYYYEPQPGLMFANGGSVSLVNSILGIQKMTPGDKVSGELGFVNNSNVNIKYRFVVNTSSDSDDILLSNMVFKVLGETYVGLKNMKTSWMELDALGEISGTTLEIILPLEAGNENQNKTASYAFSVEAVQANAQTTDDAYVSYVTSNYIPLDSNEIDSESKLTTEKVVEAPLPNAQSESEVVTVTVPTNAKLNDGASSLTLYVENLGEDEDYQGISIEVDQGAENYEVTLEGLNETNTQPVEVSINLGYQPLAVYHTHGNVTTSVPFSYDSVTGITTFSVTNFSEFTFVRDTNIIEVPNLAKLKIVRDYVNAGNSLAGKTVKLLSDLDLGGEEWTPIGTTEHPFSGIFDGQNHTIKNYKVRGGGAGVGLALFGAVQGTSESFTKSTPLTSFYDITNYAVNLPEENVFSCIIKNLNVSDADVSTTADGWSAAVVSFVKNATISNVHLSKSTIVAAEKAGGIAGFLPSNYCCFITNCSTASDVTVTTTTGNHSAGILSRINSADSRAIIASCVNNATINCAGVNGSGIAGQAKNALYYNDTNNGAVTGVTRAAGIATDCSGSVFINCTNNGYIKTTNEYTNQYGTDSSAGIASYLSSDGISVIVNCHNSGTIEGNAPNDKNRIAGIVAGGLTKNDKIINNSNTGTLINHAEGGKVYDICNLSSVANVVEPADLEALNQATDSDNPYIKVISSLTLSSGDVVTLGGQEKLEFVNSPTYLTIDLANANEKSFVIMVENTNVKLINGDNKYVTVFGKGNNILIEEEDTINVLTVRNDDELVASSLDVFGNVDKISLSGSGLVNAEVKAEAIVGRVIFSGTGTFVLTNRGTISHTTEGVYGAEHTVDTIDACNITIHNYGTIEAKANSANVASYALLFYGGAHVTFYAYAGSMIRQEVHSVMATSGGSTVTFYYEAGAGLNIYNHDYTYPQAFNYGNSNIVVIEM